MAREVGRQSFNARGDFQQTIGEFIRLRLGNARAAIRAGNPFGRAAFGRRFGWCGERFHAGNITLGDGAANGFLEVSFFLQPANASTT